MKEKIRPIYSELKGYFMVVPNDETIFDETAISICAQVNGAIDELNLVTNQNYDKFKINTRDVRWNGSSRIIVKTLDYKNKLSGLINRIQGEFFSEEQTSLNQPSTIINTNQTQNQSQSILMVLELHEKIIAEIPKHEKGTNERTFLEKLKSVLPIIKNATDFLSKALSIGAELGLDPATIHKLLGL